MMMMVVVVVVVVVMAMLFFACVMNCMLIVRSSELELREIGPYHSGVSIDAVVIGCTHS